MGIDGIRGRIGVLLFLLIAIGTARADDWNFTDAAGLPDWLELDFDVRLRYQTVDSQFRAGDGAGDQAATFRTLIWAKARATRRVSFGVELQDSRATLDDDQSPINTGIVDPLDVLQGYVQLELGEPGGLASTVQLGRVTPHYSSRRIFGRNGFRNTINAFTGIYARTTWGSSGETLHTLFTAPVRREPFDFDGVRADRLAADRERSEERFWGIHYEHPSVAPRLRVEGYLYGFLDRDRSDNPSLDREVYMPGVRVRWRPAERRLDAELEAIHQFGGRRATRDPLDTTNLEVSASQIHAELGYTFTVPWKLRWVIDWDYATGDEDPDDDRWERFDSPFSLRVPDLGPTGIFGPFVYINIDAPGTRLQFTPSKRLDARLVYKAVSLASDTDSWLIAGLRDPTGQSGSFIGDWFFGRARYWILPGVLRGEVGAAALLTGEFANDAPDSPQAGDSSYFYAQVRAYF